MAALSVRRLLASALTVAAVLSLFPIGTGLAGRPPGLGDPLLQRETDTPRPEPPTEPPPRPTATFPPRPTETAPPRPTDTPGRPTTSPQVATPTASVTRTTATPASPTSLPDSPSPTGGSPGVESPDGRVDFVGCTPGSDEVSIVFQSAGGAAGGILPPSGFTLPAVQSPSDPQAFLFQPPILPPGEMYEVKTMVLSSDCGLAGEASANWFPGDMLEIDFVLPGDFWLEASSLGKCSPGNTSCEKEILVGKWVTEYQWPSAVAGWEQRFRLDSGLPTVDRWILQASVFPFPGALDLDPPGLVHEWEVICQTCAFPSEFVVDLSPLATSNDEESDGSFFVSILIALQDAWGSVQTWAMDVLPFLAGSPPAPELVVALALPVPDDSALTVLGSPAAQPLFLEDYYFRIVPYVGGQPAGAPSNPVHLTWGALPADLGIQYECFQPNPPGYCPTTVVAEKPFILDILSYQGIQSPLEAKFRCYVVTETTTLYKGTITEITYAQGKEFCPPKPKNKEWYEVAAEAFVDFVTGAVNWASEAFDDLKGAVVDFVAQNVPGLTTICPKSCLSAVLDAGLVALGVPPSLPNFDQLMEQGFDYLAQQAVSEIGIPPELVEQVAAEGGIDLATAAGLALAEGLAKDALEEEIKQGLQAGLEASYKSLSYSVDYVPDGVPVKPHPQSGYQPSVLVLKVTRNPAVPQETCTSSPSASEANILVVSFAQVDPNHPQVQSFNTFLDPAEGPTLGGTNPPLYLTKGVPLPQLQLGESIELPIVLLPHVPWGGSGGYTSQSVAMSAWSAIFQGGTAMISVQNSCSTSDSLTVPAAGAFNQ